MRRRFGEPVIQCNIIADQSRTVRQLERLAKAEQRRGTVAADGALLILAEHGLTGVLNEWYAHLAAIRRHIAEIFGQAEVVNGQHRSRTIIKMRAQIRRCDRAQRLADVVAGVQSKPAQGLGHHIADEVRHQDVITGLKVQTREQMPPGHACVRIPSQASIIQRPTTIPRARGRRFLDALRRYSLRRWDPFGDGRLGQRYGRGGWH